MNNFEVTMARELAAAQAAADREDEAMARAVAGGPFWGEGKPAVRPGDLVGLADYLPRKAR
ncbi:MAG TPA: hypothetical protein VLN57_21045 [Xanthobacteraceae bacterium]|nr:hypothetical protein [Xanthobacteraceae bacterium]